MTAKIMIFAYSFIIGIVIGFVNPLSHAYLAYFWIVLIALGVLWAAAAFLKKNGVVSSGAPAVILMILFAATLGLFRFTQDYSMPDISLGIARVEGGVTRFSVENEFDGLHKLSIMKKSEIDAPLTVRIKGVVNGRSVTTTPVTIMPEDPLGTKFPIVEALDDIEEIFASISSGRAVFGIYKISNHIENFAHTDFDGPVVEMVGAVTSDPWLYSGDASKEDSAKDERVLLTFSPEVLRYADNPSIEYNIEGGDIQIRVQPDHAMYSQLAISGSYGYRLKVKGNLLLPRPPENPYVFDFKWHLNSQNIYATMYMNQRAGRDSIIILTDDKGKPHTGNWLVEFSLDVRDKMIGVIKQTMPYPESAFLGGVTLGMRYGLARTTYKHSELLVSEAFKWAGVNHVLAVSGLHVTIITGLFWGIFSMMKIPPRIYAPIIVLFLVMFTIITGARPSTQRAAIMNSLVVLTYVYLGGSLRASLLFGISVAALVILLFQPLLIVSPSLTLSFGAVLSLGLLTSPTTKILSKLKGCTFVWGIAISCLTTLIGIIHWPLLITPSFYLPYAFIFLTLTFFIAHKLNKLMPGFRYSFTDLPTAISGFLSAQFAIQLGMMIPLSTFYFIRWPFAGAYANFIAIPLIGVIVSLGMISGIIGMIPWFGIYIALVLNATNYVLCAFFLWIAEVCVKIFPYPYTEAPSIFSLGIYYIVIAFFIWHQFFIRKGKELLIESKISVMAKIKLIIVCIAIIFVFGSWFRSITKPAEHLKITALSVNADSILIEIPGGKSILINAGSRVIEPSNFDEGERTLMSVLCKKGVREIDYFIFSSLNPMALGLSGGLSVIEHSWVKNLILPFDINEFDDNLDYDRFLNILNDPEFKRNMYRAEVEDLYMWLYRGNEDKFVKSLYELYDSRRSSLFNDWSGWTINAFEAENNMVIIDEVVKSSGLPVKVELLRPGQNKNDLTRASSIMLRLTYGEFSFLYGGQITENEVSQLPSDIKSNVMITPFYGLDDISSSDALFSRVNPEKVIISYKQPRDRTLARVTEAQFTRNYTKIVSKLNAENVYYIQRDGGIIVSTDGKGYDITTQAEINKTSKVSEDTEFFDVRDAF